MELSNKDKEKENAKLVEYQVCQESTTSSGLGYWALTSIFIGLSAVLLAAVVYGIIANWQLLDEFAETSTLSALGRIIVSIFITIIGIGMILIYTALIRWLKRVNFLNQRTYERMREIELSLHMQKSLRIFGIDDWGKLKPEEKERLIQLGLKEWCESWTKDPERKKEYAPPGRRYTNFIFGILISLWGLVILLVWLPLLLYWLGVRS